MKTEDFIKQITEHGLNEKDLRAFTLPTFEERLAEYRIQCPHTGYYIALTDSLKLIETSKVMYGDERTIKKWGIIPGSTMVGEYDATSIKVVLRDVKGLYGIKVPFMEVECEALNRFLPLHDGSIYGIFSSVSEMRCAIMILRDSKIRPLLDRIDMLRDNANAADDAASLI